MTRHKTPAEQRSAHSRAWETAETVFGSAFLIGLFLGLLLPLRLSPSISRLTTLVAGIVLVLAGLALITVVRRQFRAAAQPTDPGFPTTHLITDGIFAWSRNPLYLAGVLVFLGVAALFDSLWLVILVVPTILAVYVILIAPEERYLAAKFGQAYIEYAASVGRWIGRRPTRSGPPT